VTASIGLAMYPDDTENAEALLNHADASMYRGKSVGSHVISGKLTEAT
jgi:GGDEF domain-containing protein